MQKITTTFLLIISSFTLFAGGPWPAGKGKGYAQIGTTLNSYTTVFEGSKGKYNLNRAVRDNTYQFYGEYGATEKLTVLVNLPFKSVATSENQAGLITNYPILLPSGNLNALGNVSVGGKYTLSDKGIKIAGQLWVESGLHRFDNQTGLRTGYSGWAFVPSVVAGASSKRLYGFVNVGYALRTAGYSEEIRSDFEIGYRILKTTWIALALNNKNSLKNGTVNEGNVVQTALYVNNQSYNAYGIKAAYGFTEKWGFNLSVYGAFAGTHVAAAPTFCASIYYKW